MLAVVGESVLRDGDAVRTALPLAQQPRAGLARGPHDSVTLAGADVDGAGRLLRLARMGEELGTNWVAGEARELAARISEGRFYVACVGQFKRGKSTLINALIGENVLPVGLIPVTAVTTVIR